MVSVRSASQLLSTSLARVPFPAGPSQVVARPSAANTGATASGSQAGRWPGWSAARPEPVPGCRRPGRRRSCTPYRAAVLANRCVHSIPTVAICTQIRPGGGGQSRPARRHACSVAGPSASMVMRIWAPLTASAGLAATVTPSLMRAAAWLAVRSHARTREAGAGQVGGHRAAHPPGAEKRDHRCGRLLAVAGMSWCDLLCCELSVVMSCLPG